MASVIERTVSAPTSVGKPATAGLGSTYGFDDAGLEVGDVRDPAGPVAVVPGRDDVQG